VISPSAPTRPVQVRGARGDRRAHHAASWHFDDVKMPIRQSLADQLAIRQFRRSTRRQIYIDIRL